jgi:hypothetical protein
MNERLLPGQEEMKADRKADREQLRGFSPQANYTDRATAACRQS